MKKTWYAGIAAAIILAGCSPSKETVATVNGSDITKDDLTSRMLQTPAAKAVLQRMILEKIIQDAASKQGVKISDAEVDQHIQVQKDQLPPGRFEEVNAQNGVSNASLRDEARTQIALRSLSMAGAKVSDDAVKKLYDQNPNGAFTKPEWKQVGILITQDADGAKKAITAIKQGVDFQTVAQKFMVPAAAAQFGQPVWYGIQNGTVVNEQKQPVEMLQGNPASLPAVRTAIQKTPQGKTSDVLSIPNAPQKIVVYVKTDVPGAKIPLEEVKPLIAYNIASRNNQTKPTDSLLEDLVKNAKVDVKLSQFKDLSKPEVLLPHQGMAPGAPPA